MVREGTSKVVWSVYSPPEKISALRFKHTSYTGDHTGTPPKTNKRRSEEFITTNQGLRRRGHGDRFRRVSDLTRVGSDPVSI